jgi:hypothetical protein
MRRSITATWFKLEIQVREALRGFGIEQVIEDLRALPLL